jgi:hypothetical protein
VLACDLAARRDLSSRFRLSSHRHVGLGEGGGVEQQRWPKAVAEPGACGWWHAAVGAPSSCRAVN